MDKKTLKNIEELSAKAKELSEIEEKIDELKGVKATLERGNLIIQNGLSDLKDNYSKEKKKLDDDIEFRKKTIKDLEQKQVEISSRHHSEIAQLQQARTSV
jgi:lipid II:glycine glycyltransferase (peptidoglycan interpeptide bridge formation enzyme)